ncbi:MAG: hypothetical protein IH820_14445 [Bacteroidetes bacterium]|nr:hypothetical protein [Bacteroidota bacterium]
MGKKLADFYTTKSGEPPSTTAFSKAAKLKRGVVGVIETAGVINAGDEVTVKAPSGTLRLRVLEVVG